MDQEIEDAFLLYLPADFLLSNCQEYQEHELARVNLVNGSIPLLLEETIDEEYYLDVVESCDVDMDNYIEVVNQNLDEYLK